MKKNLYLILAAVAAICSCSKNEILTEEQSSQEQCSARTFVIEGILDDEESKVTLGGEDNAYFSKWEEGDAIVFYQTDVEQNLRKQLTLEPVAATDISSDGKTARFTVVPDNPDVQNPETVKCRAFYNSDAIQGQKYGVSELTPVQAQKGLGLANTSLKKYAFIYTNSEANLPSKQSNPGSCMKFQHGLSYVKISFKSSLYSGYRIEKIALRSGDGTASPLAAASVTFNASVGGSTAMVNYSTTNYDYISLSFDDDVTVSSSLQDAWMVALPTYKSESSTSTVAKPYWVYFQLSKDGVTTYAKARFKACLTGGKVCHLKVGDIVAADETVDYYDIYSAGLDIKVGDLNVNRTNYPQAKLVKPEEFTNDAGGYTKNFAGGLLFVDDNTSNAVVDMSGSSANRDISTNSTGLVVVGRYRNAGSQTQFHLVDMRTRYDVAFLNLRLNLKRNNSKNPGQCLFEKNSSETVSSALRLVDCYIDIAQSTLPEYEHKTIAVVRDRANNGDAVAAPYSKVLVDNCVVKLTSIEDEPAKAATALYSHYASPTGEDIDRNVDITNNIIFTEYASISCNGVSLRRGTISTATKSPKLSINFSGNTIVNLAAKEGVIYYHTFVQNELPVKSFVANNNLAYFEDCSSLGYATAKFAQSSASDNVTAVKIPGSNNWIGAMNIYKSAGNAATFQGWHITGTNTSTQKSDPFTEKDYVNGYFPVNRTNVTNGAGADYSTKKYFNWTATE